MHGLRGWLAAGALYLLAATAAHAQVPDSAKPSAAAGRQLQTKVWVNTANGVYHCPDTKYYGKTKKGKYLPETEALKAGYRPASRGGCG